MDERTKVFWHEAFFEALQLEFHDYRDLLEFENEYLLSKEALSMDVLVIKKKPGERIDKNIGRIFRAHNIFEFKSETDSLTERDYNKVVAYALLYSSFTPVPVADITVTFAVTIHPRELLKYLENVRGFTVQTAGDGIYYVEGDTFPVQILESKRLPVKENLFMRNLRSNLSTSDVARTTEAYKKLKPFEKKNVYFDRLLQANTDAFEEAMNMSDAFRKFFDDMAEKDGWLKDRIKAGIEAQLQQERIELAAEYVAEHAAVVAKKLLLRGIPIDEIAEDTGLPYETVASLM